VGKAGKHKIKFTQQLLRWDKEKNIRQMPWKGEKDPYKIWLSEIILQQTRVEQGVSYYNKFLSQYPTIHKLAAAIDEKAFKLWEGLGYYNRCRNLLYSARYIVKKLKGKFPDSYEEILSLKGVGTYTAAAIASFAFNLPYAVVDGNVLRVLARVFGIKKPVDSAAGKKFFSKLAHELLDKKQPGLYNQAIMDFGAVVCKPLNPACSDCVFKNNCYAYQHNVIGGLPVKVKKPKIKTRWFYYFVMEYRGRFYISKRTGNDIWKNLYEFILEENKSELPIKELATRVEKQGLPGKNLYRILSVSRLYHQQLSHQHIRGRFIHIRIKNPVKLAGVKAVYPKQLARYAFPKFVHSYLQEQSGFLS
jgi:A/G-specific adenine glycosylase